MAALASFVKFRLFFDAGSDSSHATTSPLFTEDQNVTVTPTWGYYVQNVFEMKDATGAFAVRERGLFGIHWINTTGGALDTTWTTPDYTAVESAVQAFWTGIIGYMSTDARLVEHRWYAFGPGVVPPNPPSRVTTLGTPLVGSNGPTVPHQVACNVTLRTALRRHWGRIYVPTLAMPVAAGGVISSANVDTVCTAARTMFTTPGTSQGVTPVVYDKLHKRAYGMTELEVDNVLDIQRRRRIRSTTYRKIFTA